MGLEFPVAEPEVVQEGEGEKDDDEEWGDFDGFPAAEEQKKPEAPEPSSLLSMPATNLLDLGPI